MSFVKPVVVCFLMSALILQDLNAQIVFKNLRLPSLSLHEVLQNKILSLPAPSNALPIAPLPIPSSCFVNLVTCSVVQVSLLEFTASRTDDKSATVKWVTEMESDLSGYIPERSLSAASGFVQRGFIAAHNLSSRQEYLFNDANDLTVISYYRLRIAHSDGTFTYSEVKPVKPVKENTALVVYPNPATVSLNMRVIVAANTPATFIIQDASGRKIKEWNNTLQRGTNYFNENIASLASGNYFLLVKAEGIAPMVTMFFKK